MQQEIINVAYLEGIYNFHSYPILMCDFLSVESSGCMSMAFLYFSNELVRKGTESENFQTFNVFIVHLILMHVL